MFPHRFEPDLSREQSWDQNANQAVTASGVKFSMRRLLSIIANIRSRGVFAASNPRLMLRQRRLLRLRNVTSITCKSPKLNALDHRALNNSLILRLLFIPHIAMFQRKRQLLGAIVMT